MFTRVFFLISFVLLSSCSRGGDKRPIITLKTPAGEVIEVLAQRNVVLSNEKTLVITYRSQNPQDKAIREKESKLIYQWLSETLDPNLDIELIGLEAVQRKNKLIGVTLNKGFRELKKFSEVVKVEK